MEVVTFYSYKGGVGRTLACANYGLYLAKSGRRVVLADMDFEAPGLDSKFSDVEMSDEVGGLIDQFEAFQSGSKIPEIRPIEIDLPEDVAKAGGSLQLIPAGNYVASDYYKKLSSIRWETLLKEESGLAFCIDITKRIEKACGAEILVIDSRTGLSEVGGLCTQILPDTVILLTSTSKESTEGTKRIHERIGNSTVVKRRIDDRTEIDLRVVVTRMPRPENVMEYDHALKERLGMPVERLYYLFNENDLSLGEYLALDRFDEHPPILDDYVELFASLNPNLTLPYITERLESFRSNVTRRTREESERIIQELLTLFPQAEVTLEAARYYSIVKRGDAEAVRNYLRYLKDHPNEMEILAEFAQVCGEVPESILRSEDEVVRHFRTFGADKMNANLLSLYFRLSQDDAVWQEIVIALESDEEKLISSHFRETYFRALHALEDWKKIVDQASDRDLSSKAIGVLVAEAYAGMGNAELAMRMISDLEIQDNDDIVSHLRIIYRTAPEMTSDELLASPYLRQEHLKLFLSRPFFRLPLSMGNVPGFSAWVASLRKSFLLDINRGGE